MLTILYIGCLHFSKVKLSFKINIYLFRKVAEY